MYDFKFSKVNALRKGRSRAYSEEETFLKLSQGEETFGAHSCKDEVTKSHLNKVFENYMG